MGRKLKSLEHDFKNCSVKLESNTHGVKKPSGSSQGLLVILFPEARLTKVYTLDHTL